VAVSEAIAEPALELEPACEGRLSTIPYGVAPPAPRVEPVRPADAPLRVVYHGVLNERQKRILDLPAIVTAALARGVPVELTVMGGGPDDAAFRQAAAPLVARGAARLLGVVPHEEALARLVDHDVYVMTSAFEGLPNALLEAMRAGCVPVVSDIRSGIPELVEDGVTGLVAPVGDIAAFAERLERLWRDPELRRRLGARARDVGAGLGFQLESMVEDYLALFQRALDDAARGVYRRPRGPLVPPPAAVAGVSLFPVDCVEVPRLGRFPPGQATPYLVELARRRLRPLGRSRISC
jgi:glycosyltransferase involved in cell wall biosynthesis